HNLIGWWIVNTIVRPYVRHKYHLTYKKFKDSKKRQYLVLINHQTPMDQFFFSLMFYGKKHLVVTEDVMRNGFISSIIKFLISPIPFRKSSTDAQAVMTCIRKAREGGTIFLAPEGNRTYSGKTGYIKPSVAKLAKALKLPVAILKIEGGYSVQPRWANTVRKGKCRAYIQEVLEYENFKDIPDEQLAELIKEKLYNDESGDTGIYKDKHRAEYLERAIFICPDCGLTTFYSDHEKVRCETCKKEIIYNENKTLTGNGFEFPFKNVGEWYEYQEKYINNLDVNKFNTTPAYTETVRFIRVFSDKAKVVLSVNASISLYGDRYVVKINNKTRVFEFNNISAVTVLGRNKMDFYYNDEIYQIKGGKRFNALKYMFFFYRKKNMEEEKNGTFLGL
ncbi:MAG: 1-acyl-sn-glycerol-3-phosphate acyltransferase, partial [Firmicutes bacterium]|nr:1-acyl-sn-glycerol-3-phosphate acyltransferase [Candidatus Caballimonas caccae]